MDNTRDYESNKQQSRYDSSDSKLSDDLKNVKDSIAQTAQHAKDKASDLLKETQIRTADIQENVIEYVKTNPMKAVGLAIFAGFTAALLVRK